MLFNILNIASVALFASTLVVAAPSTEAPIVSVAKRGAAPDCNDASFIDAVLKEHWRHRKVHGGGHLKWNSKLAEYAKGVSSTCQMVHSGGPYGENLAECWPKPDNWNKKAREMINSWAEEIKLFDFNNPGFTHEAGHASAMDWVATKEVGCAIVDCGDAAMLTCNYDNEVPNMEGKYAQNVLPYKKYQG